MAVATFTGFAANTYAAYYGSADLEAATTQFLVDLRNGILNYQIVSASQINITGALNLTIKGAFNFSSVSAVLSSQLSAVDVKFAQMGSQGIVGFTGVNQTVSSFLATGLQFGAFAGNDNITGSAYGDLLRGQAGNDVLNGGAGADYLSGDAGDDRLIGGTDSADQLAGGIGNDVYQVSRADDSIQEFIGQGTDRVESSVSYVLGDNIENLTLTGTNPIDGTGNTLANVLIGNAAANKLDGKAGADTMTGGAGDDTYVVDNALDKVIELPGGGTDTIEAWVSFSAPLNVEHITLKGSDDINATGNGLANILTGNSGDNRLDGGTGADSMSGGAGDDTYLIDNAGDTVTEAPGAGNDTVVLLLGNSVDLTSAFANVENVTLLGAGAFNLIGDGEDNVLIGNASVNVLEGDDGDDTLDGGLGNDTLKGGAGDDTYVLNGADIIVEDPDAGNDTVKTALTYSIALRPELENITLIGAAAVNATGNASANELIGNSAANILDGGAGADTMAGGGGNDTYLVDHTGDVINEQANAGIDLVKASASYTLSPNIENLTLTGTNPIDGTGNTLANVLIGNSAANRLDGKAGADSMTGGAGDDTYVVDNALDKVIELPGAANGDDLIEASVSYAAPLNVERITLTGSDDINATGNALANTLIGNSGDNRLDGGTGADQMSGGDGDDTYILDNLGDTVIENPGTDAGNDTVVVPGSLSFAAIHSVGSEYVIYLDWWANVENLTLSGPDIFNGRVISGTTSDNRIIGGAGRDYIGGGDGNDVLMGGAGLDYLGGGEGDDLLDVGTGGSASDPEVMDGGAGNDTYVVSSLATVRIMDAPGQGSDTVRVAFTLDVDYFATVNRLLGREAVEIENIELTGSGDFNAFGNDVANRLTGNAGRNLLVGEDGDDTLDGGAGADTMVGGKGNDHYVVDNPGDLIIELDAEGYDDVTGATNIDLRTQSAYVESAYLAAGTSGFSIHGNDRDNVLTGNAGDNTLYGEAGNDTLDGGGGVDHLVGGLGDDTFLLDNPGDTVEELGGQGSDMVVLARSVDLRLEFSNVENVTLAGIAGLTAIGDDQDNHLIGNGGANTLIGGGGNDFLDGGAGNDDMTGGLGDDTYVLDVAGDVFHENPGEGSDTVQVLGRSVDLTLPLFSSIENATLLGTGSFDLTGTGGANILIGNAGNNVITGGGGNDILDGRGGADALDGGSGDDTYYVDDANQTVVEALNGGIDTVYSRSGNYVLHANVENGALLATATGLGLTGNALANTLTGNAGLNIIDGGAGADTMIGGVGDDLYTVDDIGDLIVELPGEGTDGVTSIVSYVLPDNVENLRLTAGEIGIGNEGNNILTASGGSQTLIGHGGNDRLDAGAGADILLGGEGSDTFVFDLADTQVDGGAGLDHLEVSNIGPVIDLQGPTGPIVTGIDDIYMRGGGINDLKVTKAMVLSLSDAKALYVTGDILFQFGSSVQDHVTFTDGGWSKVLNQSTTLPGGGQFGYDVYVNADATVYVQNGMDVTIL